MKIFYDTERFEKDENSVVSVGTFDGVHLGHRAIINELKRRAESTGGPSTLVTFEPHPQRFLHSKEKPIKILTPLKEKIEILEKLGLDRLFVLKFDKKIAQMDPQRFVKEIIVDRIGVKEMVVGYDHVFGKNRTGCSITLSELGNLYNFKVDIIQPFKVNGQVVKSTLIRELLEEGEVNRAGKFLGRNYRLVGCVIKGEGRGKDLEFPTANISVGDEEKLIPKDGVYAVIVELNDQYLKGVLNIGIRPTFRSDKRTIEVHILNFESNIYKETIKINFVERIRHELKFKRSSDLIRQLEKDRNICLKILSKLREGICL